jgi:hypothetical protein
VVLLTLLLLLLLADVLALFLPFATKEQARSLSAALARARQEK